MTQLYWQVYKNLEKEFLALSETIYIDDDQQSVYSMKIADLLIRTVVEIEALSKELYYENLGKKLPENELYYDTICINHLNKLWKLDNKIVYVVSPNIYFDIQENKELKPLHKAMKRGSSSSDWNKAYQAVKHNRTKELHKGNIKNFLHGLAALFILNLYYKNTTIENITEEDRFSVDGSFGSDLFSVKIHRFDGFCVDGSFVKLSDYDECVYTETYEAQSKEKLINALLVVTSGNITQSINKILEKQIKEKTTKGEPVTQEWIEKTKVAIHKELFPTNTYDLEKLFDEKFNNLRYNIVLNKQQY
jgi:hypothetical protein